MTNQTKHKYVSNILFDDDDDDENEENDAVTTNGFRKRYPPPQPKLSANSNAGHTTEEERQKQLMKIREIENRTLDSASRSLAILQESEETGIRTAEALAIQGEQLQNTNTKLDGIINNLSISQKHINGIKSVFSGIKNYISGKSDPSPSRRDASPSKHITVPCSSKFDDTIDSVSQRTKINNFDSHPATRLHGLDGQSSAGPVGSSQHVNDILDENLKGMLRHVSNLKELGQVLGNQIDQQNELIDIIQQKAEVADIKIGKQNKQMNKILGK